MSTKRPKIGYFGRKKRGIKLKKVRQKCQFLIFFNEIFTVYAVSYGEYEKNKNKKIWVAGGPDEYPRPLGSVGRILAQKYAMLY